MFNFITKFFKNRLQEALYQENASLELTTKYGAIFFIKVVQIKNGKPIVEVLSAKKIGDPETNLIVVGEIQKRNLCIKEGQILNLDVMPMKIGRDGEFYPDTVRGILTVQSRGIIKSYKIE